MLYRILIVIVVGLSVAGCNVAVAPTATPTAPPTLTPSPAPPTLTPSITPTATATATPSDTPTPTDTPTITPTPSPLPPPTSTPQPASVFTSDNWDFLQLPADIVTRLGSNPWIAFINTINRTGSGATPQPGNDRQTLYYVSPLNSASRITVREFPASTGREIFIAPSGTAFAYMLYEGGASRAGLYLADFEGITGRVLPIQSLTQRGIYSPPSWTPDGRRIALTLEMGYDLDIFSVGKDGSAPTNLTDHGSQDFWPQWSPDGRYLAFVSDRDRCPSWRPGEPGTCEGSDQTVIGRGHIYLLEAETGALRRLSEVEVDAPPRWINSRQIAYTTIRYVGDDPLLGEAERRLWRTDIFSGEARQVQMQTDVPLKLAEAWSPSGQQVIFQAADTSITIVLAQVDGQELGRISDLTFARYGMSAAWSPSGERIAIGGVNGQCPNGVVVVDGVTMRQIARGSPPPTMCEPSFSPDGRWLMFTGIIPQRDGRVDLYVAGENGFGAVNFTGSLLGQIALLGWVGGTPTIP